MPVLRVNVFLPGFSQHKCRHHAITQGTESPNVSEPMAWSNVRASNLYLEMPDQCTCRAHTRRTRILCFYGFASDMQQRAGQKKAAILTLLARAWLGGAQPARVT